MASFKKQALSAIAAGVMTLVSMPAQSETMEFPEPTPEEVTHISSDRIVNLTGDINETSAMAVIDRLLYLSHKDPKADIEMRINSRGGAVDAGLAIYDVIRAIPNDVRTVCIGRAMSMGAFLLVAGSKGKREAYPNCSIMFHQPSRAVNQVVATELNNLNQHVDAHRKTLEGLLALHSGWPVPVINNFLVADFYLKPGEARQMGFIDKVIDAKPVTPSPVPGLPEDFCNNIARANLDPCRRPPHIGFNRPN